MDDRYACRQMVVAATIWKCMGPMLVASHDVQVVETQYGSAQEEQVFREARHGRMTKERAHFSKTRENGLVWEPGMHPYIDVRNIAVWILTVANSVQNIAVGKLGVQSSGRKYNHCE